MVQKPKVIELTTSDSYFIPMTGTTVLSSERLAEKEGLEVEV